MAGEVIKKEANSRSRGRMMRIQAFRFAGSLTPRPAMHRLDRIARGGAIAPTSSRGLDSSMSSSSLASRWSMLRARRTGEVARGARCFSDKNASRLEGLAGAYSINVSSWFCGTI